VRRTTYIDVRKRGDVPKRSLYQQVARWLASDRSASCRNRDYSPTSRSPGAHVSSIEPDGEHVTLRAADAEAFVPVLSRCVGVPWVLEAPAG
jgi:hypothetical protein